MPFGLAYSYPTVTANNNLNNYTNWDEEWKYCRATTDKFDAYSMDLRKYGFTIVTGLITAGSFLGYSDPTKVIQVGVIIVSMALIVILYWLDIYYLNLLYGAVFRTRFLEIFRLNRGLTIYLTAFYKATKIGALLHFLYGGFLVALLVLGTYVLGVTGSVEVNVTNGTSSGGGMIKTTNQNLTVIGIPWFFVDTMDNNVVRGGVLSFGVSSFYTGLIIAFIVSVTGVALIFYFCDFKRNKLVNSLVTKFNTEFKITTKPGMSEQDKRAEVDKFEIEISNFLQPK